MPTDLPRKPLPPEPLTIEHLCFRLREVKLPAGARWVARPDGVDFYLKPDAADPAGSIDIVDGRAAFDPEVPLGRDWTKHLWTTDREVLRWINALAGAAPMSFPDELNASNDDRRKHAPTLPKVDI